MSQTSNTSVLEHPQTGSDQKIGVNDLTIHVATVNGSGSQSSNTVLMRSLFQMGIPISGKNLFPSNIAGLPTWFTIRASGEGWTGRNERVDVMVAMNPATARDDVESLEPGAICIYDEPLGCDQFRDDLQFFAAPFAKIAGELVKDSRLKKLLANMVYVGVVADLLGIERDEIVSSLEKQFRGKAKAVEMNVQAIDAGIAYSRENFEPQSTIRVERMNATEGKILIDGNTAAAIGALFGGVNVVTWYPITPSSSLCEALIDYLKEYRTDEDGKASFAVVQAEDEIAAIGMVIGAGWAGARALTSTSGPGISLMTEFAGFAHFAEIPGVIWDIQRVGPSTGLPTRTSQGDILQIAFLSHGDTRQIALIPGSVTECYEMGMASLDLAERLQTPVFVLSDLDLGMNSWMSDPFDYPDKPIDRGKILTAEALDNLEEKWGRYKDVDGDAIPFRTLPGTDHMDAAYFTRGSGHNEYARYTERPDDYVKLVDRLRQKYETAKSYVPVPRVDRVIGARIGLIAYGSSDPAVEEARHILRRDHEIETSYLRLKAIPFTDAVSKFIDSHEIVYVIEQNRDGQMRELLRIDLGDPEGKLRSVVHYDGLPLYAKYVVDHVRSDSAKELS